LNLLNEYLLFGGFPEIVKENNQEMKKELKNLLKTYVEKDVFFFLNIRHIEKFRNLLSYISFNIGTLLEVSSIMTELKMDFRTVENYLAILENTYLISLIPPFYKNLSTELKKTRKVCMSDLGLRNAIINNFSPIESRTDKGSLIENFVLNELNVNFERNVKYWRTTGRAEVDFVLRLNNEVIPIEVKTRSKIGRGFLSFLKTYKPRKALVFTEEDLGIEIIEETKVLSVPYFFI